MEGDKARKLAFYHFYDIIAMYKSLPDYDEKVNGIKATLITAIDDKMLDVAEFIQLVKFAYDE